MGKVDLCDSCLETRVFMLSLPEVDSDKRMKIKECCISSLSFCHQSEGDCSHTSIKTVQVWSNTGSSTRVKVTLLAIKMVNKGVTESNSLSQI